MSTPRHKIWSAALNELRLFHRTHAASMDYFHSLRICNAIRYARGRYYASLADYLEEVSI